MIFTAYCMPGMTGYDLLRKVKQESLELNHIPVGVVSSEEIQSRIESCISEEAEQFLLKPVKEVTTISRSRFVPMLKETHEDAMTEEEQKQRALLQANKAKVEGKKFFASRDYEAALCRYANAAEIAPGHPTANEVRSMCYTDRAISYYKLNEYEETVNESTKALELSQTYITAPIPRPEGQSIADWKKVIELDSSNEQARRSISRLEPLAAEKRKKLKEDMISKLKDLANSILGRFGTSIDNFTAVKDPNTDHIQYLFRDEDTLTDFYRGIL